LLKLFQKLVGQGQRPCRSPQRAKHLWAKPNILLLLNGGLCPPFFADVVYKRKSGGFYPPLKEQRMLRASPLKPTKGPAFGNRKPLKRLDLNFEFLRKICKQMVGANYVRLFHSIFTFFRLR